MTASLQGLQLLVVSPHLDDALLSTAATLRAFVRRDARVAVVTVLAGDPESDQPADVSNRRAGFTTVGEAARERRREDATACRRMGAEPVWLPFSDDSSCMLPSSEELWTGIAQRVEQADLVLLPGSPLQHPHHRWVHDTLLPRVSEVAPVGYYREQPYATWAWSSRHPTQTRRREDAAPRTRPAPRGTTPVRLSTSAADYATKFWACRAYRSQLRVLRRVPLVRIAAFDLAAGGEWLALPEEQAPLWTR